MGGMDQAYEAFEEFRESDRQFLQLEFVFTEEAREFRKDSRFTKLARRDWIAGILGDVWWA